MFPSLLSLPHSWDFLFALLPLPAPYKVTLVASASSLFCQNASNAFRILPLSAYASFFFQKLYAHCSAQN